MPRKTQRRRRKLYEIVSGICGIPAEVTADIPLFVMRGKHELAVSGCLGVNEYTECGIILKTADGTVKIVGTELEMSGFSDEDIVIRGNITELKFLPEGDV